ncbi:MAG: PD-(D/E)XK nuclease family protein [Candidatus Omnitrophica bacterium]|nr:PD-(D/E)XK nuclease family protein [Candidatus Omnitrophota bacterium]
MGEIVTYGFCEKYIPCLVGYIQKNYIDQGKDLHRLALVFGGKRPALFVRWELARVFKKSYIPPRFFSIDELMGDIVRKQISFTVLNELDACYRLYALAQTYAPEVLHKRTRFAQFMPWAQEILHFIDLLDLERVDAKDLQHIQAHAEIGYPVPEDINKLLGHIVKLRQFYHQQLEQTNEFSRGYQYYKAAGLVAEYDLSQMDQYIFCNFFYFNRCEEMVADVLFQKGKASFVFQGDERRWPILKKWSQKYRTVLREGDQPQETKFSLNIYAGVNLHAQVGIVREILKKIQDWQQTVIVLPDPNQIVPLLSEISDFIQEFNISMGYPVKRSSLYALLDCVLKTQLSRKDRRYYAKDYLKTLKHPYVKGLSQDLDPELTKLLVRQIERVLTGEEKCSLSGMLFLDIKEVEKSDDLYGLTISVAQKAGYDVSQEQLSQLLQYLHQMFFAAWEEAVSLKKFVGVLQSFLREIITNKDVSSYPLNVNIAHKLMALICELGEVPFTEEVMPVEDIFKIFNRRIESEIIAFKGSPLKGLQILGLFETRSLNFENVIVLDMNEGALPRLNLYEPLIPRDVMISLNLDRLEQEEEIQRYQFLRLISSARNVHLVYQESRDKERSRFIEELVWEEQKKFNRKDVLPVVRSEFSVTVDAQPYFVKKTPAMIEFLRQHVYSASSLNMYVRNPIDFYFAYVLGVKEKDDLLDEPESKQVGTFIHELLEKAYLPFIGKQPVIDDVFRRRFFELFEVLFKDVFDRSFKSDSFLLQAVLRERLQRLLTYEDQSPDRKVEKILCLEKRYRNHIPLSGGNISFNYIVDRIDQMQNGSIMVIDYKTGSAQPIKKNMTPLNNMPLSREVLKDQFGSFQLPLYYYFLKKEFGDKPLNAAIYNIRTLEWQPFLPKIDMDADMVNQRFLSALEFIMQEILNPKVDFIHDPL